MSIASAIKEKVLPDNVLEEERVKKVKDAIDTMTSDRKKWEYKWREAEEFYDGRHFVRFNRATGSIEPMRARPGSVFRVNHIAWKKLREMQNTILMNDPRWKPLPSPDAVEAAQSADDIKQVMDNAARIKSWLDELYKENRVKVKVADTVHKALKLPYSAVWIDIDDTTYKYQFEVGDAFDTLIEGDLDDEQKAPRIVKQFKRNLAEFKANPRYKNTDKIKPDNRQAASDLKNDRNKAKFTSGEKSNGESVICYESWEKVYLTDDVRKKIKEFDIKNGTYKQENVPQPPQPKLDPVSGNPIIDSKTNQPIMRNMPDVPSKHWTEEKPDGYAVLYVTTTTKDCEYFHREEYVDFPIYPVAIYRTESGPFLQLSLLERLMSPNKSLDVLQSKAEEYAAMAGGRIVKHENTNLSRVETDMGTVMEYNGTIPPTWENAPDLPPTILTRIGDIKNEIDTLTVVGGNVAQIAHNGRGQGAMESIMSSDMASVKTPIDFLADFLEKMAVIVLTLADYYMDEPQTVRKITADNKPDYFKVIGARYAQTDTYNQGYKNSKPPIPLDPSTIVKVEIEPGVAYTEQQKFDTLMQMVNMGVIDSQTALEQLRFENVGEIVERMMKEKQVSMINTPDFQAMSPETKLAALRDVQSKNISIPVNPTRNIGTVKKISHNGRTE